MKGASEPPRRFWEEPLFQALPGPRHPEVLERLVQGQSPCTGGSGDDRTTVRLNARPWETAQNS